MVSKKMTIQNKSGLHVRPAGMLVKVITPFESEVTLRINQVDYNGRSVLGIMSAAVKSGDEVEFFCSGIDEDACLKAIEEAVQSGLGE